MRIALVAPTPVPYVFGGAENVLEGLRRHLAEATPHAVEVVALPSPEADFWSLMASYRAFAALDLARFDRVISMKYPAWMVAHPHHAVWMLHRLRGLYDTYALFGLPQSVATRGHRGLEELLEVLRRRAGERAGLDEVFARLEALRHDDVPPGTFDFPGPLARLLVHHFDAVALAPGAIARHAAISRTVAQRPGYFPAGSPVAIAYPPTALGDLREGPFRRFFTVSRLDGPKRLDLLVRAFRASRVTVPLRIAGTGPEADRLAALAGGDCRIEFVGFLEPAAIATNYAEALAVPFVPHDEDYGLVTLEAMLAGKPVITVTDAGGPTELVVDGATGRVVAPTVDALRGAIEAVAADPEAARTMGAEGRRRAADITWSRVLEVLLGSTETPDRAVGVAASAGATERAAPAGSAAATAAAGRAPHRTAGEPRGRLVVATSYPVYPPRGGGQVRLFELYRRVAQAVDVSLVTLGNEREGAFEGEIAPGLREIRVPKSAAHARAEAELTQRVDWVPVTDIALGLLHARTPAYGEALRREASGAHAVIASHPFALPALRALGPPLWFEAHNHEAALKAALLPAHREGRALVDAVRAMEGGCWREARRITTVTEDDAARLRADYGAPGGVVHVVPNGVDEVAVRFLAGDARQALKARLGLAGRFVALFMGSWHGPNIEAAREVLAAARAHPDVVFLMLGSVCQGLGPERGPPNLAAIGEVDAETRIVLLGAADLALNPMRSGSGSNLKMLDYMAAGAPVLTTTFGARGLGVDARHALLFDSEDLAGAIAAARREPERRETLARAARAHVEAHFGWDGIARRWMDEMNRGTEFTP